MNSGTRTLPDAEEEYASMKILTHIYVRNSSLEIAPKGWARVPSKLTIDLTNSKQFSELPFVLCAFGTNLTKIELDGTSAGNALNWTGQLRVANMSASDNYLNTACRKELEQLPDFATFLLANNDLRDEDLKDDGRLALSTFQKLTRLDVRNNLLENVQINVNENVYRPIVERFVKNVTLSSRGVSVSFAGNPRVDWRLVAGGKTYRKEWSKVVCTVTAVEGTMEIIGCSWRDPQIVQLAVVLPHLNVKYLKLSTNDITAEGAKALAAVLPSLNLKELHLEHNLIGDEGAKSFAAAIPNSELKQLILVQNNIGVEGAKALAAALPSWKGQE